MMFSFSLFSELTTEIMCVRTYGAVQRTALHHKVTRTDIATLLEALMAILQESQQRYDKKKS